MRRFGGLNCHLRDWFAGTGVPLLRPFKKIGLAGTRASLGPGFRAVFSPILLLLGTNPPLKTHSRSLVRRAFNVYVSGRTDGGPTPRAKKSRYILIRTSLHDTSRAIDSDFQCHTPKTSRRVRPRPLAPLLYGQRPGGAPCESSSGCCRRAIRSRRPALRWG